MGGQQAKESDWKKSARDLLKTYYTSFAGTQWHEFNSSTDKNLVRAKIGYALFGPPTNAGDDMDDIDDIENAYNDEQRERAQGILDVILRIYDASRVPNFRVGFIFVFCKQNDNEFAVPVFSVFVGTDGKGNDMRNFVDTQGRTYKDWDDWKNNNCLPKLDYAYPELGYFTCSGNSSYEYDPEQDPDIEYGSSPQSSVTSDILKWTDVGTSVASLGLCMNNNKKIIIIIQFFCFYSAGCMYNTLLRCSLKCKKKSFKKTLLIRFSSLDYNMVKIYYKNFKNLRHHD